MRIIALQAESSVAAALNMMGGWEVVFAADALGVQRAMNGTSVVLIGGGTELGLERLAELRTAGVDVPALVLGDVAPPADAGAPVLSPPFTLDELRAAVESVAPSSRPAPSPPADRPIVPPLDPVTPEQDAHEPARTEPPIEVPRDEAKERDEAEERAEVADDRGSVAAQEQATRSSRGRSRRRGRSRTQAGEQVVPTDPDPVGEAIRVAANALRRLSAALETLPVLGDVGAFASAVVDEVRGAVDPSVAAVFTLRREGYVVVAGHRLSPAEERIASPEDHPLFSSVRDRGEGILIAPVDLARGLVSGVPGTRTEALIVSPLIVDGTMYGALLAGADDYGATHLEALDGIATQASAGFAVAAMIDRLRREEP